MNTFAWRPRVFAALLLLAVAVPCAALAQGATKLDMTTEVLKQTKWRSLGPATMGGRVADVAVDEKNPYTFYVALATGGLLKTGNDGTTWTPVFDTQNVASIGAVAVAPSDSKIIYVGTGEANGRNSSSWGDGVYKSEDAGAPWKNVGLKDSRQIGRIAIDPNDAKIAYVAAAGHLWGPNKERGVYKTTDGGKTWQASLTVNADTGAIDLALGKPGVVIAAMYQRRRTAWGFSGLGEGAGLYRSTDSGKTWKKITQGLPSGALGRIGVSVCRSKPDTMYTVIESPAGGASSLFDTKSKYGGVFRSDDGGATWKRVSPTAPRGFYFGQIRVDPVNAERVYVLGFGLTYSEDGGKTFKADNAGSPGVHSDLHALWIDPARPEHLLLGSDGGLYVSHDRAQTWQYLNNFPMGEFYEISVDNRAPYWVYGGLQDNGSWAAPSALQSNSGPANADWISANGGDGFYVLTDLIDTDVVYSESQGGDVERWNRRTNQTRSVNPSAPEGQPAYRFNWDAPLALSRFDHDTLYMGGSHLFKVTKKAAEWAEISPDLSKQEGARITAGGSGAETYGTIVTISESPLKRGLLWIGTDDGNVQLTQDEGRTWTDVTKNLPARVRNGWVARLEASRYDPARAYAAINAYRGEDFAPYLFATDDMGRTWRAIVGDLPAHGPIKAFREDPVNPNLLFVGTEFGAFVSLDRGGKWRQIGGAGVGDLPTVCVNDLAIQPRDHALVAATHGRSIWVLDNIATLEDLTPATLAADVHLFPIPPVVEFLPSYRSEFAGAGTFHADNPPGGAEIVYWLKTLADAPPKIAITDAAGKSVADLTGERYPGLNRLRWDLRASESGAGRRFSSEPPRFVKPGLYTVTLTVGKEKRTQKVTVSGLAELSEAPVEGGEREKDREED